MANKIFELGETEESDLFWSRNPHAWPALENLLQLANKCFGREYVPKNRAEDIAFNLGQACRDDFGEIVFLAIHGHGNGAVKLLRGLYERAVTVAYLTKKPEKAERFVRFAAIQEHRVVEAALKVITEEQFDAASGVTTVADIRKLHQEIKPEFQITACKICKTTRTAVTWDMDIASIVHSLSDKAFDNLYLLGYALPTMEIHATLASTGRDKDLRGEADIAFSHACALLFLTAKYQNRLFQLGLEDELVASEAFVMKLMDTQSESPSPINDSPGASDTSSN